MFRVEAFVEDKKLGEVLMALAGLCRGQPSVTPAINIDATPGKGPVKAAGSGNIIQMLGSHLRHVHKVRISAKEIGMWLKSVGRSPMSASYVARGAVEAKILKRASNVKGGVNSGIYDVVNPTKAAKGK
jgi:hypothetical protein